MSYVHPNFGNAYLDVLKKAYMEAHKETVEEVIKPTEQQLIKRVEETMAANVPEEPEVKPEETIKEEVIAEPAPEVIAPVEEITESVKVEEPTEITPVAHTKASKKKSAKTPEK